MRAVSVTVSLVVDADNGKLILEVVTRYADGTIRSISTPARSSLKVDLDLQYAEAKQVA